MPSRLHSKANRLRLTLAASVLVVCALLSAFVYLCAPVALAKEPVDSRAANAGMAVVTATASLRGARSRGSTPAIQPCSWSVDMLRPSRLPAA